LDDIERNVLATTKTFKFF